jgi:hypothetical protein
VAFRLLKQKNCDFLRHAECTMEEEERKLVRKLMIKVPASPFIVLAEFGLMCSPTNPPTHQPTHPPTCPPPHLPTPPTLPPTHLPTRPPTRPPAWPPARPFAPGHPRHRHGAPRGARARRREDERLDGAGQ